MKQKYLIEYGRECDLIEEKDEKYIVRLYGKDETTDKTISYKPIENKYKYDDILVEKDGKFARIKKYTTYLKNGVLVYAYKLHSTSSFSDSMIYEEDIEKSYKIIEKSPFLSAEEIESLMYEAQTEKAPVKEKIGKLETKIKELEKELKEIDKKHDIYNKCEHFFEESHDEKINNGKTTKKTYECGICGKEDVQYWHKIF